MRDMMDTIDIQIPKHYIYNFQNDALRLCWAEAQLRDVLTYHVRQDYSAYAPSLAPITTKHISDTRHLSVQV